MPAEHLGLRFGGAAIVNDGELDASLTLDRQNGEVVVAARAIGRNSYSSGAFLASSMRSFTVLNGLSALTAQML